MDKKTLKKYIKASIKLINLTEDVDDREWLFNKLCEVLNDEGISYIDWVGYSSETVYNSYINWDANCGFQIVDASAPLEEVMKYVPKQKLNANLTLQDLIYPLSDDGNRTEYSTDIIYGRAEDTDKKERYKFREDLWSIKYIANTLVSLKRGNEGEEEFKKDLKKYLEGVSL